MPEGRNGHNRASSAPDDHPPPADGAELEKDEAMRELRRLLLAPEQDELDALRERLRHLELGDPDRVAKVLPEAITRKTDDDDLLADALRPTIEETLKRSVRRDPQALVDALFPVIGPAIRKSIRETLSSMLQTVNQTLEHSLSPRSLRWRFEAWRTDQSFAEIVLHHTLQYRVEQLFLIDRTTGLPLAHVTNNDLALDDKEVQDGALVTSMLTAIQDFVEDSFGTDERETLETMKVGDLAVWVEPGPRAVVAAVIRGLPPPDFRDVLSEINEAFHLRYQGELEAFDGDTSAFEPARSLLRPELREQLKERDRTMSPIMGIVVALVLLAVGIWVVRGLQERQRWHAWLTLLDEEPGLVVIETDRSWSTRTIRGLRDPLAADPDSLRRQAGLDVSDVVARWEPYQALDATIVVRRAHRVLTPPASLSLFLRGDTLVAAGPASAAWVDSTRRVAPYLPGITTFRHADPLDQRLDVALQSMTQRTLRFVPGTAQLRPDQNGALRMLDSTAQHLLRVVAEAEAPVRLQVVGHASTEGSAAFNERLSQARADSVRQRLIELGWPRDRLTALGTGTPRFPSADATPEERAANRSVSFRVVRDTTGS